MGLYTETKSVSREEAGKSAYLPVCWHWGATFVSNLTAIHIFYLLIFSLLKGK